MIDEYISDRLIMGRKVTISQVVRKALAEYLINHRADQDMIQKLELQLLQDEEFMKTHPKDNLFKVGRAEIYLDEDHHEQKTREIEEMFDNSKFNPKNR
jgi:hypothetical protein